MPHHHELASIVDATRLKADLRVRLHATLPNSWMPELERFLDALGAHAVTDSRVALAILADVADYMNRLIGAPHLGHPGAIAPPLLQDPVALNARPDELYARFRGEMQTLLRGVERRRLVRASQARRIANLLDERVHERWTLARLASVTGWSRSHLDRVFRHEMGMSVREYVARAKIKRAVDLIQAGEKIEVVILMLGYRNKTSFYQLFRRYTGVAPGDVRKRPSDVPT